MSSESKPKSCLIHCKFLGSKVVERGTSDIELGCLLHSITTKKKWTLKKRTPVTLGFVKKSFVITFNHHEEKTHVCDLRDVSKVCVHPTRERVVGFVLNDRHSQKKTFLCFRLCRKANMKGQEFKRLHQKKVQLHHPAPKAKRAHHNKTLCPTARLQAAKAAVPTPSREQTSRNPVPLPPSTTATTTTTTTLASHLLHPSPQEATRKTVRPRHKYGYYVNGKLIGVGYQPAVSRLKYHAYEPVPGKSFPTYENLSQYQQQCLTRVF